MTIFPGYSEVVAHIRHQPGRRITQEAVFLNKTVLIILVSVLVAGSAMAGSISVPVPAFTPDFETLPDGIHITSPGFISQSSPGDPALPYQDIRLIVPPTVVPSSLKVSLIENKTYTHTIDAKIAPSAPFIVQADEDPILDWGPHKNIHSGLNAAIYAADSFYPASNVQLISLEALRKWKIATVRYYPIRYNPPANQINYNDGGRILLTYSTSLKAHALSPEALSDNIFANQLADLTVNYSEAKSWYTSGESGFTSASLASQQISSGGYLILTTSAIASASTSLQAFVQHKQTRGFTVEIATENDWGGGVGDVAAENIRAYLTANYINKQIRYVLLIGDPHPEQGSVPMKMLWPRYHSSDSYRRAPSDYYYADLTGNWDLNGDGFYGQEQGDFGLGGIDRLPEVIVGRIPYYNNVSDLDSILQKIINYESGALKGNWQKNVLLSMKPSDQYTPGYPLGQAILNDTVMPSGLNATRVYESDYGLNPPPEYTPCNYTNTLSAWQQHAGFHFWWTHGDPTTALDVFKTDHCQYLSNNYPSFIFQCACENGWPERSDNLGYSLLKQGAIATTAATRVSWYRSGQTSFANSDSNSGMTYTYARKLIRDNLPCGDAHYAMLVDVPNDSWMNHCVFNLYGDPSLRYPTPPSIYHIPPSDTDITTQPYLLQATIKSTSPLENDSPKLHWNTDGSDHFTTLTMSHYGDSLFEAYIPAQPLGTTVYYHIEASDTYGESSTLPEDVPQSLLSFSIKADTEYPSITHTPLTDTGNKFGPYPVTAVITDDLAVQSATLYYSKNNGPVVSIPMEPCPGDTFAANIPGPASFGDVISYYITATDTAINPKTSRLPEDGQYSFSIYKKIYVGVLNSAERPFYFTFGNSNSWQAVTNILNSDPQNRFHASVITDLKGRDGAIGLDGQDVLYLPDNTVPIDCMSTVSNWFQPGKVIVAMDSSAAYAAYTGWMWPDATGANGYGIIPSLGYWTNGSLANDQKIYATDPITKDYSVGDVISSVPVNASLYMSKLPADAKALTISDANADRCYAAYRDVPAKGRIVLLGPYSAPTADQYSIIRESAIYPRGPRTISITSPNGGESYEAGAIVPIKFDTSGDWLASDEVKIEYRTDTNSPWQLIPGAGSLSYDQLNFSWSTAGLPGSYNYSIRISTLDNSVSDQSDAPFAIIPTISISAAKSAPDGSVIALQDKVITCNVAGYTYIEEKNRQAGIKISGDTSSLIPSTAIKATGIMHTVDGERVLQADSIISLGPAEAIRPYIFSNRALGGSAFGLQGAVMEYKLIEPNIELMSSLGLNNIGLLARVTGRVVATGSDWFYIDDGSKCDDGSGVVGVKVLCPGTTPPAQGSYVLLNGVSSTYFDRGYWWRALVLPSSADIRVVGDN